MNKTSATAYTNRLFMLESCKRKVRIDGRSVYEPRALKISFVGSPVVDQVALDAAARDDTSLDPLNDLSVPAAVDCQWQRGHAEARVGQTVVIARVSATIITPTIDRPAEGTFAVNCDIPADMPPTIPASQVQRLVDRAISETRVIDTTQLCIEVGTKVLAIRVDIRVLNDDGSLVDAATCAAIAALLHFRRPAFSVNDAGSVVIHPPTERAPLPLSIHHTPLALSFAFLRGSSDMILDPSSKEEELTLQPPLVKPTNLINMFSMMAHKPLTPAAENPKSDAESVADNDSEGAILTVVVNRQNEVCLVVKPGGAPVAPATVLHASRLALTVVADRLEVIRNAILADRLARKVQARLDCQ
ncbi:hypothetical protein H696_00341 [Fonticula alba]|uniref:Exoribonuclease phosphorolytic domain-containing protein n=1 Tax=Fonticula alba TaxID=691883 RepID=A0A058ZFQ9_FONAL|nr:hypothetical protein H696_00341 [Fonticula alba]KCV72763.1 hypothetical protein H696_00341 [Fonticula alba]|eukprot:XP_009492464.1 hypothetical protein H696_00341 [Fonticula alba]